MVDVLVQETLQATDHGLEITTAGGDILGGIAQWSWSQAAKNTRVRAFGNRLVGVGSKRPQRGEAFENVGGNLESVTIQFSRMEVWTDSWVSAFGIDKGSIQLLNKPLILTSSIATPEAGKYWRYTFYGCRIDSFNQAHDVNGDRCIKGSGTISCQAMEISAPRAGPF